MLKGLFVCFTLFQIDIGKLKDVLEKLDENISDTKQLNEEMKNRYKANMTEYERNFHLIKAVQKDVETIKVALLRKYALRITLF